MKEAYYFHDDTVILNYSKKYVTYKREIIETDQERTEVCIDVSSCRST